MVFTVFLNNHSEIIVDLLQLYYPNGAKAIDVTYGTGGLWWGVYENPDITKKYVVTKCDAEPNPDPKIKETIEKLNLLTVMFHLGVFQTRVSKRVV